MQKDKIIHINVFNGDDGIQYIRYSDMEKMLKRIKEVHDKIEDDLKQEVKRLKEETKEIEKLKRLFRWVVIKPNQFNSGYELFNVSKQELYAFLYLLRCSLLNIKWGKEVKNLYFDSFMVEEGKDYD